MIRGLRLALLLAADRVNCLIHDHDWEGYDRQPLRTIRCRRCGLVP